MVYHLLLNILKRIYLLIFNIKFIYHKVLKYHIMLINSNNMYHKDMSYS
jgi:hypothetical protein